jgi:tripartite-type tricarboxylate transporter receptor subunit TctC
MLAAAMLAAATLVVASPAAAQPYPNHPLRLIVPFAAGGSNDVMARLIAPHLEQSLGQPVIVDNRPAAAGQVGTDAVAKAPPDGHTLLLVASSHTVTPALNPKLPYNTEKDFAPISLINTNAMVFLVHPGVAANTLAEFVALAKREPGRFNYASPGVGSQTHLTIELLSRRTGIKLVHIPSGRCTCDACDDEWRIAVHHAGPERAVPAHRGRQAACNRDRHANAPSAIADGADHRRAWHA